MTDWSAPIDGYCERLGPGFWAEPVNALSNAAFLVAAAFAFTVWRRRGAKDGPALGLIGIVAIIGVGSFLFHTFASKWSLYADVLPIAAFIYGYLALALRRYLGLCLVATTIAISGFAAVNLSFVRVWTTLFGARGADLANGSVGYVPPALAMVVVGGLLMARSGGGPSRDAKREAGRALLAAACVFALSLLFRSVDHAVCARWPLGTHFAWHALNAAVLFILIRAAIRFRERAAW